MSDQAKQPKIVFLPDGMEAEQAQLLLASINGDLFYLPSEGVLLVEAGSYRWWVPESSEWVEVTGAFSVKLPND